MPDELVVVQGKKEIAKALRVFVDHANYPVLVHCIHGKDRTGLIVMLIMLLCSVEPEVSIHCTRSHKQPCRTRLTCLNLDMASCILHHLQCAVHSYACCVALRTMFGRV